MAISNGVDGSVSISVDLSMDDAERELDRLKKKILSLEENIRMASFSKSELTKSAAEIGARLDEAKAKLYEMENASKYAFSNNALKEQQNIVRVLQGEYDKVENEIDRCNKSIRDGNIELGYAKQRYGEVAHEAQKASTETDEMSNATERMSTAMQTATSRLKSFGSRVLRLATSALVFSTMTKALTGLRSWIGQTILKSDEAVAAIARLKGALLTLAQPLVNVVIPAFIKFVNTLTRVIMTIARIMSSVFKFSLSGAVESAKSLSESGDSAKDASGKLKDEADAYDEVGEAAEEAQTSLAGFDEINVIATEDAEKGSKSLDDTGSGLDDVNGASSGSGIAPDFTGLIGDELSAISELFVGVALLALGAILTFTGANIPLGLALMVIGALFIYDAISENWGEIRTALQGELGLILAIVGGALLVIGAILALSGVNIPLGIALMAIGAASLATVVAANWDAISQKLQGTLGIVTALLSGAFLVFGAILAFSGVNIPLGIALIALGVVGLGLTAAANWDAIQQAMQGPIGDLVTLISGALLVVGSILAFSGVNLPLGIGLMAAGAIGLAAYAAINWDSVSEKLNGPVGAIVGLISGAFLVLGAVLAFSGANIPLGIGLLVIGAAGLAASITANWDTISDKLEGPVGTIVALMSGALLVLGAILVFSGAALPLGIGLLVVGAVGLATSIAAKWNTIQETLGGKIAAITAIVSAALLVLGVILIFTGAGIPLGIGLLLAGAAGLAATVAPNWNFILDKLKGAWEAVKQWWKTNVSKFLSMDYWINLGKNMIDGLIQGIKNMFSGLSSAWQNIKSLFSGGISTSVNVSGGGGGYDGGNRYNSYSPYSVTQSPFSGIPIPKLATGAVIPPNREFMAVLGDQENGMNIETPENLLRKIMREESGGYGDILRQILQAIKDGHIIMVDETTFGMTAIRSVNAANRRAGKQLLKI